MLVLMLEFRPGYDCNEWVSFLAHRCTLTSLSHYVCFILGIIILLYRNFACRSEPISYFYFVTNSHMARLDIIKWSYLHR